MLILDTFCGEGGAAVGLKWAWPEAEILGIDAAPKPRYPFTFRQDDAINFIRQYGAQFDFIWASPPCHAYSWATSGWGHDRYLDLVAPTREALLSTGKPYIIENVLGAPLFHSIMLCGTMFNLRVFRHRIFEANFKIPQPVHPSHDGRVSKNKYDYKAVVGHHAGVKYWADAIGIHWMSREGITQAVPPRYSEYLGQFIPAPSVATKIRPKDVLKR